MESPSKETNTVHTTPAESRADVEEAAGPETADVKRGIQWREIIRQAFDKARQTQQPRTTRRELSKDKSKSLVVLGGAAVAMFLLFLGIFSSPQKAKRTEGRAGAPDLGRRITPGQESGQSGSVTPMLNAEVSGDEAMNRGDVTPEEMLLDRACPGGGWNAGNGVVYGVPLAPHLDATAIALLALGGDQKNNHAVASALDWLEHTVQTCSAPWSLAWSILALDAHSRPIEGLVDRLCTSRHQDLLAESATLAAVILAIDCLGQGNVFKVIA